MPRPNAKSAVILLAEDDPGDRELTTRALQAGVVGAELHAVSNGETALNYLQHRGEFTDAAAAPRPALVLLDVNMPRLDGWQVLQAIRNDPELRRIPVVMLTTSNREQDIVRSYELGCNSFITKADDLDGFTRMAVGLDAYWFELVTLPPY